MRSFLRGVIRLMLFLFWCLLLVPPYLLVYPIGWRVRRPMVQLWHKGACKVAGIDIRITGYASKKDNILLVSNHVSYLDIPVLASTKDMTFVAKADVADWPLFGFLAKIAQTIFIERNPQRAADQKDELQARLASGEHLLIFPEGTSTDGTQVNPFKSALFQIVMEGELKENCYVQPVTIACRAALDGDPDLFSWHGDMTLLPHLWKAFCSDGMIIDLLFHPPAKAADFTNRKELCQWAHDTTSGGLEYLQTKDLVGPQQNHQTAVIKMQAE